MNSEKAELCHPPRFPVRRKPLHGGVVIAHLMHHRVILQQERLGRGLDRRQVLLVTTSMQ